jgi:hypothetical protein
MKTMWFDRVGELHILVHGTATPAAGEWLEHVARYRSDLAANNPPKAFLVVSAGGGPNSMQRKQVIAVAPEKDDMPVVICSSSAMARGITTALRWISKVPYYSFEYDEIEPAYRLTGATAPSLEETRQLIFDAQERLGIRVSKAA